MTADALVPSSIVLLTRGGGPEAFLVRRAERLAFFGGYLALPGGKLDAADVASAGGDEPRALAVCALRELFEETGVLPAALGARIPRADRAGLRAALQAGAAEAGAFRRLALEALAAPDGPRAVGDLVTPPFAPVRYRTRLFHLELPAGEEPRVVRGELDHGSFRRPADVLERWTRGLERVAPPVLHLLDALARAPGGRTPAVLAEACAELARGRLFAARSAPGVATAPLRTPTVPPATTTNAYLVGGDAPLLVDPGTPYEDEQARLLEACEALAAEGRPLAGILLTHHHPDHVGAVSALSTRLDVPVHAHARTLSRLAGPFRSGRALRDGDEIDLGPAPDGTPLWRLRALHTPGHDTGHLCFLESRYGALLAGDLVSTLSTVVIDPPEGHMATYLASLARARDLAAAGEVDLVCPAHGPASARPRALLEGYLAHRRARERKLEDALGDAPRAADDLCAEVYDDAPPELRAYALRSLAAGLQKLAEEGRARAVGSGWARA